MFDYQYNLLYFYTIKMKQIILKQVKKYKNIKSLIMKKFIAIVAVVVIAILGLSSYNTTQVEKSSKSDNLIAELKTGGNGGVVIGNNKKVDD